MSEPTEPEKPFDGIDDNIHVYISAIMHLRYLVVEHGEHKAKERIPLHIWNLPDDSVQKKWFMKQLVTKVKRKIYKMRGFVQVK